MALAEFDDRLTAMRRARDALAAENEKVRKDVERLNAIEEHGIGVDKFREPDGWRFDVWRYGIRYSARTAREAIDAALAWEPMT